MSQFDRNDETPPIGGTLTLTQTGGVKRIWGNHAARGGLWTPHCMENFHALGKRGLHFLHCKAEPREGVSWILLLDLQGFDTTAATASFCLHLLGNNPDVQAKLHEELDVVCGNDLERPITIDDIKNLPYLECVVKVRKAAQNALNTPGISHTAQMRNISCIVGCRKIVVYQRLKIRTLSFSCRYAKYRSILYIFSCVRLWVHTCLRMCLRARVCVHE